MEISYWQSRWQKGHTGWHMSKVYPPLQRIWPELTDKSSPKILLPLCGKSLDMKWLAEQDAQVTGVEVSSKALDEFMDSYPDSFSKDSSHGFTIYRSDNIELWQGDFLKLPKKMIAQPDIIYDKAALVALPKEMRKSYAQKLLNLCDDTTKILLQTFEYKQEEMNGPPFSVDENELNRYFGKQFSFQLVHEQSKFNELAKFQQRGLSSFLKEKVLLLIPS